MTEPMKKYFRRTLIVFLFAAMVFPLSTSFIVGDDSARIKDIRTKLEGLAVGVPGLNSSVELSVNGLSAQEFIRGLAVTDNLNVSVDPTITTQIFDNFSNVTVIDVFLFLCERYNLDITFIGNIMVFTTYVPPPVAVVPYSPKIPDITWDASKNLLTCDLKNDSLALVARELTHKTGKNVVFAPDLIGKTISVYIENDSLADALDKLAFANDLSVTRTDDFFHIERKAAAQAAATTTASTGGKNPQLPTGTKLNTDDGLITLDAVNAPIGDLVNAVSFAMHKQYFLYSDLKGNSTFSVKDVSYESFLDNVLNATDYTYRKKDSLFYIGDRSLEGLRVTHVFKIQYRTADKVPDYIPGDLKKDVEVKAFPDMNSIILCGSEPHILEIEDFLRTIDQVVPMVQIEVMILDVNNSHTVAAGIQTGFGNKPANGGAITPDLDVTLDGNAINNLISGINGFGWLNIGYINPDFYVHVKALEQDGVLKVRSTPKLATLNGTEATMSIGSTEYYLERTTNIIGTQNPQTQITNTYKPLTADFSLSITPMVSGDEQVTLTINVKQSSFTKRVSDDGPYGTTERSFQSTVRVKNEEMILLGGLEDVSDNESGEGTPFLSRIPGLKWLFGTRSKTKSHTKLSILIRPVVII
jgi:type IV pilus assembly protein PilQ